MCVRFHRQDSNRSLTSRASSRTKRDEKRRDRHVTGDDVKLPFPHEESQPVSNKSESVSEDVRSAPVDYTTSVQQANDSIRRGVSDFQKVVEQLLASNEALRRQRDVASNRADELREACVRLTSENLSLRGEVDRVKEELKELHQQRVNDWKQRNVEKEKLSRLNPRKTRDKQTVSTDREVKDVAANLHVTGSSLRSDAEGSRQAEVDLDQGHRVMLSRSQRMRRSGRTSHGHVIVSETVETLPEHLLAATYPPRPRPPGHPLVNTLPLPSIPHRTSST